MKQNDTRPAFKVQLFLDDEVFDLTANEATAVEFNMATSGTVPATLVSHGACTIVDSVTGVVEYRWVSGDTATPGDHKAEFQVTLSGGRIVTFPNNGNLIVTITPELA